MLNAQKEWFLRRLVVVARQEGVLSRAETDSLCDEIDGFAGVDVWRTWIARIFDAYYLKPTRWVDDPDASALPMVAVMPDGCVRLVFAQTADGSWRYEGLEGEGSTADWGTGTQFAAISILSVPSKRWSASSLFKSHFFADRRWIVYAGLVAVFGNLLALATSLYSMQVYDRVIPTQGISTLIVLTVGTFFSIAFETILRLARSSIVNKALVRIDVGLSTGIFDRLLRLRMDQFPSQVGSLSGQLRGYEVIRSFTSAITLYLTADAPYALFFLLVIFLIGGPHVALVPLIFLGISLSVGLMFRRRVERAASEGVGVGNRKLGLLVEAVNGAETIKAGGFAWQVQSRWNGMSRDSAQQDMEIRHLSETSSYLSAGLQQLSYVAMIATGAVAASSGDVTTGALVACSILSSRVLGPVAMIPGLLVQWAHAKASHKALEGIFSLQCDNHDVPRPLAPPTIYGSYTLKNIAYAYERDSRPVSVTKLQIAAGEKVAILGSIGSGKSTLLRIFAGLYRPQAGQILLDGLDIHQICRARLSDSLGYLPQHVSLFGGTLRENLTAGVSSCTDEEILKAAELTGLKGLIVTHPKGLDLPICEGGAGLSGGQTQLVAFTRLMLSQPNVWLLDEPTASMDSNSEERCIEACRRAMAPAQTVILVTQKPALLALVDRIVIMTPEGILMDGPRDAVLKKLAGNSETDHSTSVASEPSSVAQVGA